MNVDFWRYGDGNLVSGTDDPLMSAGADPLTDGTFADAKFWGLASGTGSSLHFD